jgi:hypothetical protein
LTLRRNNVRRADYDALLAAADGRCPNCGATDVQLEVRHIVPLAEGGSGDIANLEAVCPDCHRALDMMPREGEFIAFLARLLERSPSFSEFAKEPMVGPERLRPDLFATQLEIAGRGRRLLIECKSYSVLSAIRLAQIEQQLQRYRAALPERQLVLAIPGKVPTDVADSLARQHVEIWDLDRIGTLFAEEIIAADDGYYAALFRRALLRQRPENQLIRELKACPTGLVGWSTYQKLVGRALEMLFCPPLSKPFAENPDYEKINRRDLIFPNYASEGFWLTMRQRYGADYVLIDAKNGKGKVSKSAVLQIANYLKRHGVGLFAIILGRQGPDRAATITIREQWLMHSKLIVVLTDADLEAMLLARLAEGDPASVLSERIQQFRLLI